MQRPTSVENKTHNVEVFCHMILEEFMTTRNMQSTLRAFRKEWDRPTEVSERDSTSQDLCSSKAHHNLH